MNDEFFISPASESQERAARLPTTPSEDVSHLLPTIEEPVELNSGDYLPSPAVDWIIDLPWQNSVPR